MKPTESQFYLTDERTDAQTFVQFLILSRYVYVKVDLEAFVNKFISKAFSWPYLSEEGKHLFSYYSAAAEA